MAKKKDETEKKETKVQETLSETPSENSETDGTPDSTRAEDTLQMQGASEVSETKNESPPAAPPPTSDKVRIKSKTLTNTSVAVLDGVVIEFDGDGIAAVEKRYADYLLEIPSYTKA